MGQLGISEGDAIVFMFHVVLLVGPSKQSLDQTKRGNGAPAGKQQKISWMSGLTKAVWNRAFYLLQNNFGKK
jgi:hypothetical protein